MAETILVTAAAAFVITYLLTPRFTAYLENSGIVDKDLHKEDQPWMASSAGLPVVWGFLAGVLTFVFIDTFLLFFGSDVALIFAAVLAVMIATFVGLLDDIHARRRRGKRGASVGLRQWQKPLLTGIAAVPLMAVRAGVTSMSVPMYGLVDFGLLYPLVLVPVAVLCVTNATNMLAGMNGLEAGLGIVALTSLGIYGYSIGSTEAAAIGISAAGALLALFIFNFYPASILPGDSLTYLIGAAIVSSVIIGNMEKFGLFIFTPWILEAFLKLRSGFGASSVGTLQSDGTLKPEHDRIYSLTHVGMRAGLTERGITLSLILFEVLVVLVSLYLVGFI